MLMLSEAQFTQSQSRGSLRKEGRGGGGRKVGGSGDGGEEFRHRGAKQCNTKGKRRRRRTEEGKVYRLLESGRRCRRRVQWRRWSGGH